jgi:hypothetical protein
MIKNNVIVEKVKEYTVRNKHEEMKKVVVEEGEEEG